MSFMMLLFNKLPEKLKRIGIRLFYIKKLITLENPKVIFIEPTNYCNYKCTICPITSMKRKRGFMDFDLFKKIIDETSRTGVKRINLQMYGEPLLHPKLPEMIKYAKSKPTLEIWFDTNVYLLKQKLSEKILESKPDGIILSFHGPTKEIYKKIHSVNGFDQCIKNIKNFKILRDKMKMKTPKIVLQSTRTDLSIGKNDKIFELFRNFVDKFSITECNWCCGYSKENHSLTKLIKRTTPCFNLLETLAVLWDGTVTVCCADFDGFLKIGNIKDNSLMELWKSKKLQYYRKLHLMGKFNEMPLCENCMDIIALSEIKRKFPLKISKKEHYTPLTE